MSLMGNHGYDESADAGELLDAQSDAEYFAQTVAAERAERLLESARQQRDQERALADRFGWR